MNTVITSRKGEVKSNANKNHLIEIHIDPEKLILTIEFLKIRRE